MDFIPGPKESAVHRTVGSATWIGNHVAVGEVLVKALDRIKLSGEFESAKPVVFIGKRGRRLVYEYGQYKGPGKVTIIPINSTKVIAIWDAYFKLRRLGSSRKVRGSTFRMIAITGIFDLVEQMGEEPPSVPFLWFGQGRITYRRR